VRLYQRESYRREFESEVLEVRPAEGGSWVRLAETLFYPTSGGQPHDTGRLGGAEVAEVRLEDGEVWHRLQGPLPEVGWRVSGEINWERRYRHMQRHTAQHLLSQAFLRVNPGFETRSVSLSGPICTVDFAGEPQEADLEAAEGVVNEAAYAGLEVRAFEVDEGEISRYPLRRAPKVSGRIRLVAMGDFELSACGGTHLRTTAEAAPIKLLYRERVKGPLTRVGFCAGWEALADYGLKHRVTSDLARGFSAGVADLSARVRGVQEEVVSLKQRLKAHEGRLAEVLARELLLKAEGGAVAHVLGPEDAPFLQPLARNLAQGGVTALLAAPQGARVKLLFASGGEGMDVLRALRAALPFVAGRGGGQPDLAQGSGSEVEGAEEALRAALQALR